MREIRLLLIIVLSIYCFQSLAQDSLEIEKINNHLLDVNEEIEKLSERQNYQNDQINSQTGMIDTAFDGISAEISASSYYIGIFGIVIAIFSIALSIYVSKIAKNVSNMKSDNELLLQKNIQIKTDLESLSEKITKDSSGLYKIIQDEESNHLTQRLIAVPEDICNLFGILASRDLSDEHFLQLKEGYLQIKDSDEDNEYKFLYMNLFFQHFSEFSIVDKEIAPSFIEDLDDSFDMAFKIDTINSVKGFFKAVFNASMDKYISEINSYILAMFNSKYAEEEEVYFTINNSIPTREGKFQLYDLVSKAPEYNQFRKRFGNLISQYEYPDLTAKELAIINESKEL